MPDVVGYRAKIGVILPSTNTVVEHDLSRVRPDGVTFHSGRFYVEAPDLSTNEKFLYFLDLIRDTIPLAVRDLMTCKPDHILMGMSAETFWGGKEGNAAFEARVREISGDLGITSGADACNAALSRLGVNKIACITPYQTVGDDQVHGYFTECGFDVKRVHGLKCATATSIADIRQRKSSTSYENSTETTSMPSCNAARTCRWSRSPTRPSAGWASRCWRSTPSACGTPFALSASTISSWAPE